MGCTDLFIFTLGAFPRIFSRNRHDNLGSNPSGGTTLSSLSIITRRRRSRACVRSFLSAEAEHDLDREQEQTGAGARKAESKEERKGGNPNPNLH